MRSLAELPFDVVLPGHGEVQRGRRRLFEMLAYIEELNGRVREGKRQGQAIEELQARIAPETLRTLAGDYGRYVREMTARFRPLPPGTGPGASLADAVRGNVAAVYQKLDAR